VAHACGLGEQPLTVTGDPKFEPSTTNCTEPVGVALPEFGDTVAVNVTDWPNTDGFALEPTAVVVGVPVTVTTGEEARFVSVPPLCLLWVVKVYGAGVEGAVTAFPLPS
jgi:hypothetical protein